jgi:dCTP deaminase
MSFSLLSDRDIECLEFIENFESGTKRPGIISFGLSSYGYDIRIADRFKIFTNINGSIIDPKAIDEKCFSDFKGDICVVPPNSYVLGESIERFNMPQDVIGICLGKSTYARAGIAVNCTPIEPGFKGTIVVEVINATPLPAKIYAGEGIAQIVFFRGRRPLVTYADKRGKYQDQSGIVTSRVD